MQHPTNQNHTTDMQAFPHGQPATAFPFRSSGHRRSHSEVHFRIPVDLDPVADPLDGLTGSSFEELGSEDDIFCTYMDMEKLGSRPNEGPSNAGQVGGLMQGVEEENSVGRGRHRYSNSVDGCSIAECIEAKKAMAPDKLAELWTIDPRRAKRIIANRQSAARSKERKARYMTDLERKVQTLQTEATTLAAQLTLFQRDTTGLTSENTELKLRLQAMEQQAQLRDALNEALKKEVERLKIATGETMATTDSYDMGIHHIQYNLSPFFHPQPRPRPVDMKNLRMSQYHPLQSKISTPHRPMMVASNSHAFSEMPHDPVGRLQELDISNSSSLLVKSEGPSISASESSSI